MRRILVLLAIVGVSLLAARPAEAGWGWHRHRGWGGGWGGHWRGGYGYYGGGYRGFGGAPWYGGYGVSLGYYRPGIVYGGGGYGGWCDGYGGYGGYGGYAPLPIGNYGFYGSTYNPGANFIASSAGTSRPAIAPATVRNLLSMSREELLAALRAPAKEAVAEREATIAAAKPVERPAVRISNAEQRGKAEQHLAVGDILFQEQKFHSALQRYKLAAKTAPDMAEAYWRQGHALIATANFELAGGALKRAIALDGDTTRGDFRLDELYGGAAMAKSAHLESLAGWALTRSESSEPYFLMGVQLYYDGQGERAERFFARAAELAGIGGGHLAVFAPAAIEAEEAIPMEPDLIPPAPAEEAPVAEKPELAISAAVEI